MLTEGRRETMFEWKVEEMALLNERRRRGANSRYKYTNECYIFDAETETLSEDKIVFIDSMTDGMLTYLLKLAEKLDAERDKIPKDKWGDIRTNSLQAWLKRNDTRGVCVTDAYFVGKIRTCAYEGCTYSLPDRRIQSLNQKGSYEYYDDYINEAFHKILYELCNEERAYFESHDEYCILAQKAKEVINTYGSFGGNIYTSSNGEIGVYRDDPYKTSRPLTKEELEILIEKGRKAKEFMDELSKYPIAY